MKEEKPTKKKIKIEEKTKINIKNNNKSCLIYSFGSNEYNQLCLFEDKKQRKKPEQIISLNKKEIIQVTTGDEFTLFLSKNGKIYSCGKNDKGQLGLGDFEEKKS